jgi:hypothetical protein
MIPVNPLRDPDPALKDGGVDIELIKKLVGGQKTLDLDTKIKVGGKEMSLADLIGAQAQLEALTTQNKELGAFREGMLDLLDADLAPAKRKEILVGWYKSAGLTHEDAVKTTEAELARSAAPAGSKPKKGEAGWLPEEEGDEDEEDDVNEEVDLLKKQVEALTQQQSTEARGRAVKSIQASSVQALDSHKDLGILFTRIGERAGDKKVEAVTKAKALFATRVEKRVGELIRAAYTQTGKFDPDRIPEFAVKAAGELAEEQKAVIGEFQSLGKSPATVPSALEVLKAKEPVKEPTDKDLAALPRADAEKKLEEWLSDAGARDVAAVEEAAGVF